MKAFLKSQGYNLENWAYGLVAATINGGASAVVSGLGLIAMDPNDFNLQTGRLYTMVAGMFVFNGLLGMMSYLKQQPLPPPTTTGKREKPGKPDDSEEKRVE